MILGDAVILSGGGGSAPLAAFAFGTGGGTTATRVGSIALCNSEYFTVSGGVFTCVKAGTYTVTYFVRGGRGSNTNRLANWSIQKNGSTVTSGSANYVSGANSSVSVTLAAGDTLYAQCASANSTGNGGYWSMGINVVPA